jgi:hypothetical protein
MTLATSWERLQEISRKPRGGKEGAGNKRDTTSHSDLLLPGRQLVEAAYYGH